ncbi:MAG: TetR/AcrR family transcriptional regulator [Microthrixaceae bacterium]
MEQLKGVVPPKQQRSRETVARILRAAEDLVADRAFRDITVQDICISADVSPSSFYARFPTKEDVLLALFDLHSQEARADATAAIGEVVERSGTVDEVVRALLGAYLRFVRRNGQVMTSIFSEPALVERYMALGSEITGDLGRVLGALFGADDRQFLVRAEFAARLAAAGIQRAIGVPTHFGERMGLDDEQLLDELTSMLTPYLRAAAESPSRD